MCIITNAIGAVVAGLIMALFLRLFGGSGAIAVFIVLALYFCCDVGKKVHSKTRKVKKL